MLIIFVTEYSGVELVMDFEVVRLQTNKKHIRLKHLLVQMLHEALSFMNQ